MTLRSLYVVALLLLAASRAAEACSPPFAPTVRQVNWAAFLGTAMPDTVAVTAGSILGRGHARTGAGRAADVVHGQLVHVDRIGDWPAAAREALRRAGGNIVLVLWGAGADCSARRRSGTARFITPGQSGFYLPGELRERSQWAGGRPTFDIIMVPWVPYTGEPVSRADSASGTPAVLTPAQLLELHARLPLYDPGAPRSRRNPTYVDFAPMERWARAHPDLATRWPANQMLLFARSSAELSRVQRLDSPLVGTWRFAIVLDDRDTVRVSVRTDRSPTSVLPLASGVQREPSPSGAVPPSEGYYLLVHAIRDTAWMPETIRGEDYLAAGERPMLESSDSTVWSGAADILGMVRRSLPALSDRIQRIEREIATRRGAGAITYLPGRFTRDLSGAMRFELRVPGDSAELLRISGTRVSMEALPDRP
jgi:hypothetical protein